MDGKIGKPKSIHSIENILGTRDGKTQNSKDCSPMMSDLDVADRDVNDMIQPRTNTR